MEKDVLDVVEDLLKSVCAEIRILDEITLDDDDEEPRLSEHQEDQSPAAQQMLDDDHEVEEIESTSCPSQENVTEEFFGETSSEVEFRSKFVKFVQSKAATLEHTKNQGDLRLIDLLTYFFDEQSRRCPLAVRKMLDKGRVVKPKSVSLPPSQIVNVLVEFDADTSPATLATKYKDGAGLPADFLQRTKFMRDPCPNFTRCLYDVGFSLVSEATYRTALQSQERKAKEPGGSKITAGAVDRIRRYYEEVREKNAHFKCKLYKCKVAECRFVFDTLTALESHKCKPHRTGYRLLCGNCGEFKSQDRFKMAEHYLHQHRSVADFDENMIAPASTMPNVFMCSVCDEDFGSKRDLKQHERSCVALWQRGAKIVMSGQEQDVDVINKRLWPSCLPVLQPPLPKRLPALMPMTKDVRKSVADIVESVCSGDGKTPVRSAPTKRFPPFQSPFTPLMNSSSVRPALIANRGTTFVFRNGATTTINNGGQKYAFTLRPMSQQLIPQQRILPNNLQQPPQLQQQQEPRPLAGSVGQTQTPKIFVCEICDCQFVLKATYIGHLRDHHKKLREKTDAELSGPAPLACSRCKERFYTFEGLERHLVMKHCLVTSDLLQRAQKRIDSGKCKLCGKVYSFSLLHHLVQDHKMHLCSAEIVYSCDLCAFRCKSYVWLENHLRDVHSNASTATNNNNNNSGGGGGSTVIGIKRPLAPIPAMVPAAKVAKYTTNGANNGIRSATKLSAPSQFGVYNNQNHHEEITLDDDGGSSKVQSIRPGLKKVTKYCCTPCSLKFDVYDQVVSHWVERHLKKVQVNLCRIDDCRTCLHKLEGVKVDFNKSDEIVVPPLIKQALPRPVLKAIEAEDPDDIICLD